LEAGSMFRGTAHLVLTLAALGAASAHAQDFRMAAASRVQGSPVHSGNATLQQSLKRIAGGSGLWRDALEALRGTGRYALVLTPDQVVVADIAGDGLRAFDHSVLAEVAPVESPESRVNVVLVVINLPLLEQAHAARRSLPAEFEADLDRILVHEIYGHAMPYLFAGDMGGKCADPSPGERPSDACAIRRENAVRAELRLGRRVDAGLEGLSLARRDRH
jgi:hypothetical protein